MIARCLLTNGTFGDYPNPAPVSPPIVFTLYTTTGTGDPDSTATITVAPGDRSKSTTLSTLRIDEFYIVTADSSPDTTLLAYQVLEGPGTLYLGEYKEPTRTPTENLTTSKTAFVFLYLNRGDSRVRVYVDGGHPEDGATIAFYYTGTDRDETGSGTPPPPPPPPPTTTHEAYDQCDWHRHDADGNS